MKLKDFEVTALCMSISAGSEAMQAATVAACSRSAGRSFGTSDRVEVLSREEGFVDAWATASIVSATKEGRWLVEYAKFVDANGKLLREKVVPAVIKDRSVAFLTGRALRATQLARAFNFGMLFCGSLA
eukprot:6214053-Pleurochrysis_carterae.AAC.8